MFGLLQNVATVEMRDGGAHRVLVLHLIRCRTWGPVSFMPGLGETEESASTSGAQRHGTGELGSGWWLKP